MFVGTAWYWKYSPTTLPSHRPCSGGSKATTPTQFDSYFDGTTAAQDAMRTRSQFGTSSAFDQAMHDNQARSKTTPKGRSMFDTDDEQGEKFRAAFPRKAADAIDQGAADPDAETVAPD